MKAKLWILAAVMTFTVQAGADCQIINQFCLTNPGYDARVGLFADVDFIAHHDPNRCLQRAREWLNYCANIGYSASYFSTGGVYKIAVVVTPGSSQIYSVDFANRWIAIAPSY